MQVQRASPLKRAPARLRAAGHALRARAGQPAGRRPVEPRRLREALLGLGDAVEEVRHVRLPASRPPWTPTGLAVSRSDRVTWLASGHAFLIASRLGLGFTPAFQLHGRVASGAVRTGARDTLTFTADADGPVELCSLTPGELRADGTVALDGLPYRAMTGGFDVVLVRWAAQADPPAALERAAKRDPCWLCAAEAARLRAPSRAPAGWSDHPHIGPSAVFRAEDHQVACRCQGDVGIVRHPVDVALTASLWLRWSWNVEALPSALPEDTLATHHYLGIAVEFDDGRDLTWHWSAALPPGFAYRCPLPHWRHRETHVVVRSGPTGLGEWLDEQRPVRADHQAAIGGELPSRVVAVWLIANGIWADRPGRCRYGRIELVDGDRTVDVLGGGPPAGPR